MMPVAEAPQPSRRASPLTVARAVLSAFLGIRGRKVHDREAVTITPVQAIIAGLIGAAVFVGVLLTVVWVVTK